MNDDESSRALFLLANTKPGESAEADLARKIACTLYVIRVAPIARGEIAFAEATRIVARA